jgi:hypothetical protein
MSQKEMRLETYLENLDLLLVASSNALLTVYRNDAGLKDLSDQAGPSGLMRGTDPATGVAVKVLVEV